MKKERNAKRISLTHGIASSLVASLCCVTPLVVVLIGFGSLSIALSFLRYRPYFLLLGFGLLSIATYIYIKKDYGKCNLSTIKQAKFTIITSIVVMVAIYVGLTYFLIPPILISQVQSVVEKNAPDSNSQSFSELKVKINGMTCSCNIADIEYNLMQMNGVMNVSIDYNSKIGIIKFDPNKIDKNTILQNKIFTTAYSIEMIN